MSFDPVKLSKFLSFILRHKPDSIGLVLDPQGWIGIDELIEKSTAAGTRFSRDELRTSSKPAKRSGFRSPPTGCACVPRRGIRLRSSLA